jgi:hypothetical protein
LEDLENFVPKVCEWAGWECRGCVVGGIEEEEAGGASVIVVVGVSGDVVVRTACM